MFSIALIGPDGAGKTTIAHMLEEQGSLPFKYIYMGMNISASNYALPTSRLFEYLREWKNAKFNNSREGDQLFRRPTSGKSALPTIVVAAGRLANYLAEESYRQVVSWVYRLSGHIVVYDRHFLFDFSFENVESTKQTLDARLHRWFLTHVYPRPDLVIYLDAPAEVLFARKGEKDVEDLGRRREAYARQMKQSPNCVVVDGTQPLSKVYTDVSAHIFKFHEMQSRKSVCVRERRPETPPPVTPDPDHLSKSTR